MISAISYSNLPENVVPGKTRITQINPTGNFNGAITAGQTVSWHLGGMEGFMDPYDTYFKVTVSFANNANLANDTSFTNKLVQLDGSASSLFSQLLLIHGNEEIERIQEYDALANVLNDMDFDHTGRGNREHEGVGGFISTNLPSTLTTAASVPFTNSAVSNPLKAWGPGQSIAFYTDTNARTAAFGLSATQAQSNGQYTTNHPIINQRYAFQLVGTSNDINVTFSGVPSEYTNDFTGGGGGTSNSSSNGPLRYFDPQFGGAGMEPFFSQTVLQRYLSNGFIKTDYITSATWCVAVNSGIIGRLMNPQQYKMPPLWLLPNLRLEMSFANHAFFTSWFSTNQGARSYQITDIKLMTTILEPTEAVKAYVNTQYMKGIKIPTQTFTMGPRNIVTYGAVPPTVQINLSFQSLRNIIFFFISNDYLANTAARKHYRFSMAINSIQVRIGNDFYPQLPITGNGGTNLGPINNYEFLRYLYACFGKHVCPKDSAINASNFAINCRLFNPQLTSGNMADDRQWSFLEENRVIGKAVYGVPLDKLNMDCSTLGGVNTQDVPVIELLLGYSSTKVFDRPVTMMSFCHHDTCLNILPGPQPIVTVTR